ncbi:hypothetical protein Cpir12675_003601 [Ceratocystis pirilliformis]|uniref:Uncharacterized protein n=1 Tax=Ceratocystis pirilliformis TaxID=259994 RepID=A0ABR3Z348_9PEZI
MGLYTEFLRVLSLKTSKLRKILISSGNDNPDTTTALALRQTTVRYVLKVRAILSDKLGLPVELVDLILDMAECWVCSRTQTASPCTVRELRSGIIGRCAGHDGPDSQAFKECQPFSYDPAPPAALNDKLCTGAPFAECLGDAMPWLTYPVRKLVFTIYSYDQGWTSLRTDPTNAYYESYTWFEVGLERFVQREEKPNTPDLLQLQAVIPKSQVVEDGSRILDMGHGNERHDSHLIQINRQANSTVAQHCVEWRWDDSIELHQGHADTEFWKQGRSPTTPSGEFVRNLQVGDIITIWAKARDPGWVNKVESVTVDVHWAC